MTVFAMLGAIMYASKVIMEGIPNVHLLGVFTVAITVVYRKKALYAIYTFVFLTGLFGGFSMSSVVTRNISPAPSQSLQEISGVCAYTKPFCVKKVWIA